MLSIESSDSGHLDFPERQIWYIVGGAVCMGMGILAFFIPSILNMEDHRAAPEAGESEVTLTSA